MRYPIVSNNNLHSCRNLRKCLKKSELKTEQRHNVQGTKMEGKVFSITRPVTHHLCHALAQICL